ncbi:YbjN domain-containing protein [Pseudactinotalea sp. Z1739]|uniref:YbjN domain-containing protein n=1 Tax=Pseudactinotalea sp. Z1739 TaxID=3413028 RepID=UPI003C7B1A11
MSNPDNGPDEGRSSEEDQAPAEEPVNAADFELSEEDIAAAEVHPVTPERIRTWLKEKGHNHLLRPDGQPAGIWNGSLFTFTVTRHVLQIRGQWSRTITIERRAEFMALINHFHTRNPWPKCLLQVMDDGSMRFTADLATPISAGMSEQQLTRAIRLGIGAGLSLFAQLDKQFPDPLMTTGAA